MGTVGTTLDMVKKGARFCVVRLDAERSLADRLRALGLGEGARAELVKVSCFKKVYYVRTASATTALGADVARRIGVET